MEETSAEVGIQALALPVGSLEGVVGAAAGIGDGGSLPIYWMPSAVSTTCPLCAHFFPDRPMALVTLTQRVQGLMISPANPKSIRNLGRSWRARM